MCPIDENENSGTVGNAAAMRKALDGMLILACGICANKNGCEDGRIERCGLVKKARAAIAAPPRNCDFYDTKTDAETGFVEETGEDDRAQHYWQVFANWLFAPASERKGGNDGE